MCYTPQRFCRTASGITVAAAWGESGNCVSRMNKKVQDGWKTQKEFIIN